jgi:2-polyprenyl-3-methyl-5-hydroxy-6-metoxy-1,4-benzoquinol methylase
MEQLEFAAVTTCPVCRSKERARVEVATAHAHRLEYWACQDCGLVRMDPRPTSEAIGKFYRSVYMGGPRDIGASRNKQRDFAHFMLAALAANTRLDAIRSVLDFGCGYGDTLHVLGNALAKYGDVAMYGIEPSDDARALAQEVCALVGYSHLDIERSAHQYDLIVMSHVLEHMFDPVAILELIRSQLAKEGILALEVPNYHCHPSTDLVHNFLFTPVSLRNTLGAAGFEIITAYATDHCSASKPAYLTVIAKSGTGAPLERESHERVLAGRRAAVSAWPGFTMARGPKQLARRMLGRSRLG